MYDKFIKTIKTDRYGDMEVATAFVEYREAYPVTDVI